MRLPLVLRITPLLALTCGSPDVPSAVPAAPGPTIADPAPPGEPCCHFTEAFGPSGINGIADRATCDERGGSWFAAGDCAIVCCPVPPLAPCDADPEFDAKTTYCVDHFEKTTLHDCQEIGGHEIVSDSLCAATGNPSKLASDERLPATPTCCVQNDGIVAAADLKSCRALGFGAVWTRDNICPNARDVNEEAPMSDNGFPIPPSARRNDALGGATSLAPGRNFMIHVYDTDSSLQSVAAFYDEHLPHARRDSRDDQHIYTDATGSVTLTRTERGTRISLQIGPR
jgi:hypothetical protein